MARKRRKLDSGIEMDMTPMIDIVFLLIAFFMIVSDLSQLEIQTVILPEADMALVTAPEPGERKVIINIVEVGKETGGVEYEIRLGGDPKGLTLEELTAELKREVLTYNKYAPAEDGSGRQDSLLKVLVRCHEAAPSRCVQQVWAACSKNGIYKTGLAALTKRTGDPYAGE